jgi:hypothetical protein
MRIVRTQLSLRFGLRREVRTVEILCHCARWQSEEPDRKKRQQGD